MAPDSITEERRRTATVVTRDGTQRWTNGFVAKRRLMKHLNRSVRCLVFYGCWFDDDSGDYLAYLLNEPDSALAQLDLSRTDIREVYTLRILRRSRFQRLSLCGPPLSASAVDAIIDNDNIVSLHSNLLAPDCNEALVAVRLLGLNRFYTIDFVSGPDGNIHEYSYTSISTEQFRYRRIVETVRVNTEICTLEVMESSVLFKDILDEAIAPTLATNRVRRRARERVDTMIPDGYFTPAFYTAIKYRTCLTCDPSFLFQAMKRANGEFSETGSWRRSREAWLQRKIQKTRIELEALAGTKDVGSSSLCTVAGRIVDKASDGLDNDDGIFTKRRRCR